MDTKIIKDLICPVCKKEIFFAGNIEHFENIETGNLKCNNCQQNFEIINGVPKFVIKDVMQDEFTVDGWGQQWQILSPEINEYFYQNAYKRFEEYSLTNEFFFGKKVLDVGCGAGRWSKITAERNAEMIFAIDLSSAIFTAKKNLSKYKSVHFF